MGPVSMLEQKRCKRNSPRMKKTKVLELCPATLNRRKRGNYPPAKGEGRSHKELRWINQRLGKTSQSLLKNQILPVPHPTGKVAQHELREGATCWEWHPQLSIVGNQYLLSEARALLSDRGTVVSHCITRGGLKADPVLLLRRFCLGSDLVTETLSSTCAHLNWGKPDGEGKQESRKAGSKETLKRIFNRQYRSVNKGLMEEAGFLSRIKCCLRKGKYNFQSLLPSKILPNGYPLKDMVFVRVEVPGKHGASIILTLHFFSDSVDVWKKPKGVTARSDRRRRLRTSRHKGRRGKHDWDMWFSPG